MIGIVWVNHHALVRSITKVDRTLLFLNLVLLLFVVLIPFATATEADYFSGITLGTRRSRWCSTAGCSSACRSASARSSSGRCTASASISRCRPSGTGRPGCGSSAAAWSTWPPSWSRLFNAVAAFVLIALVAVYYILENTPASPGAESSGDDEHRALKDAPRLIVAIKQVSRARLG